MSIETSIGWVPDTVNPILGLCPEEYRCWYCYASSFYSRFHRDTKPRLHLSAFEKCQRRRKPTRYFLGSTHDLFGPWLPKHWFRGILGYVRALKRHTFLLLTKYPHYAIDLDLPDNLWLGTTITKQSEARRVSNLCLTKANLRFISAEPLLGSIRLPVRPCRHVNWLIIGALSLPGGRTRQPDPEWVEALLRQADRYKVPVYMKSNLVLHPLFGLEALRQEIPNG